MKKPKKNLTGQSLVQKFLFRMGVIFLLIAATLSIGDLMGLVNIPEFLLFGESALKMYARIAVLGCVAAAIGSWESPSTTDNQKLTTSENLKE
jgi:hypothetical protein